MNDVNGNEWYVIYCKFRMEGAAEKSLGAKGYEVYRPVIRNKKSDESLFPRYLFVRMTDLVTSFHDIQYTFGVSGFVRFAEQFARASSKHIDEIRHCEILYNENVEAGDVLAKGDVVELNGCGFDGLKAIFQEHSKERRVTVLMEILGRESRVSVPTSCVSKG
ncbi:MAG: transcription termination/antitermination NusG family protein [Aestuariibacter sp.]